MDDGFDLENAIQTKAEFSCVTVVIDKIGGWEEEFGWDPDSQQACENFRMQ